MEGFFSVTVKKKSFFPYYVIFWCYCPSQNPRDERIWHSWECSPFHKISQSLVKPSFGECWSSLCFSEHGPWQAAETSSPGNLLEMQNRSAQIDLLKQILTFSSILRGRLHFWERQNHIIGDATNSGIIIFICINTTCFSENMSSSINTRYHLGL